MKKKEKIRLSISIGVLAVSVACLALIISFMFEASYGDQEASFPFRIEKRIMAANEDGSYSYDASKLPFSFKLDGQEESVE